MRIIRVTSPKKIPTSSRAKNTVSTPRLRRAGLGTRSPLPSTAPLPRAQWKWASSGMAVLAITLALVATHTPWNFPHAFSATEGSDRVRGDRSAIVGQWKFDDGSGTTAADSSGNGNTGTLQGGATWVKRPQGSAIHLDGSTGYVSFGNPTSLQPNRLSVVASFQTNSSGVIMRKRLYGYGLQILPTQQLSFWVYDDAATKYSAVSPNIYADGKWHQAVGVYDGSSVTLFVDGVLVAKASAGTMFYGPGAVAIGRDGDFSGQYFKGSVDDVRIYNSVLSDTDVAALFVSSSLNTPRTGGSSRSSTNTATASLPGGLVAQWTFDQSTGTPATVADASGNGNTVTLSNGAEVSNGALVLSGASGANSAATTSATGTLGLTGDMTIAAWVNPSKVDTAHEIFGKNINYIPNPYNFFLAGRGRLKGRLIFLMGNGSRYGGAVGTHPLVPGQWQHIAVTVSNRVVTHFLNGAANGTGTIPSTVAISDNTTKPFVIGTHNGTYAQFNGSIDDVQVYNRALSAAEIASLAATPHTPVPAMGSSESAATTTATRIGQWKFDDGNGTIAVDSSGAQHNGTLVGNVTWTEGVEGTAVKLDGTTGSVRVNVPLPNDFTAVAWVRFDRVGSGYQTLFGTNSTLSLVLNGNHFSVPGDRWSAEQFVSGPIQANQWYHLAYVRQGATVTLYLNGQKAGSRQKNDASGTLVRLGVWANGQIYPMSGELDGVSIYSNALSATDVASLAATPHTPAPAMGSAASADTGATTQSAAVLSSGPSVVAVPDHLDFFTTTDDTNCKNINLNNPLAADADSSCAQTFSIHMSDGSAFSPTVTKPTKPWATVGNPYVPPATP